MLWRGAIAWPSRILFGLGGVALIYPAVTTSIIGASLTLVAIRHDRLLRKQKTPAAA